MITKKRIWIAVGITVLAATVGFAAWKAAHPGEKPGKPVQTVKVKAVDLEARIFANGKIRSKLSRTLTGDAAGKVMEVKVREGDRVEAGQVLCVLDSSELTQGIREKEIQIRQEELKLQQASLNRSGTLKSQLDLAAKNVEIAREELAGRQALYATGAASLSELREYEYKYQQAQDTLTTARIAYDSQETVDGARLQIEILQSELQRLRSELAKMTVTAPVAGTMTEVAVKPLDVAAANQKLFVIEDMEQLEAVTNISEFDVSKVRPGQEVLLRPSGLKGQELKGTVAFVAPAARVEESGQTRETVVEVRIDVQSPPAELKSNFSTEVVIRTERRAGALVLPYEALYTAPDGTKKVFEVVDGIAKERTVKTGIEGDLETEVGFEGVREGAEVILNPSDQVADGDRVSPLPDPAGKEKP